VEPITFILAAVISFLASIVGGMVGGSFLLTIPLLIFIGLEPHYVIGITRVFMVAMGLSFINYQKNGHLDIKSIKPHLILFLIGTIVGSLWVIEINETLLQVIIGALMIIVSIFLIINKKFGLKPIKIKKIKKKHVALSLVLFLILGVYEGFYAAASSVIVIMMLTSLLKKDFKESVGAGRFFDFSAGIIATIIFASKGLIDFKIAIPLSLLSFAGAWVGSHITIKKDIKFVRYALIVLSIVFAIKLLFFS